MPLQSRLRYPRLANVEQLAARFPESFGLPDHEDRARLRPGDFAKLVFLGRGVHRHQSERMWVRVVFLDEDGRYLGVLDNRPTLIHDLRHGDRLSFGPEHVADILGADEVQ